MSKYINILGISAFYHDSAACLLQDGEIVAAAQEERFSRRKHDPGFPSMAIEYCLKEAEIHSEDLTHIIYYDKPLLTFDRLLMTYLSIAPSGLLSFTESMPIWLGKKLHMPKVIQKETGYDGAIMFSEHHEAHAASAFYPSPFQEAAILTIDGVGEWATASYGIGSGKDLTILKELHFPDSVGLLYSAFTYFTGFRVNSGEYKLMGLAPYGKPKYAELIYNEIVDVKSDGSIRLNMSLFDFLGGFRMTNKKFAKLFNGPARKPETPITQREMDIAASIQKVTEDIVLKMAAHVKAETDQEYLCMAGGVALNCVANGRILRESGFKDIWIQPAAGDAGGALGAALSVWHRYLGNEKKSVSGPDIQKGSYLGPRFKGYSIKDWLDKNKYSYYELSDVERAEIIAQKIADGKIVGHYCGRMEFGPRALGARSILGDPRRPDTQSTMNLKIKFRESFRPFAPSVLEEVANQYFDIDRPSPYMLLVSGIREERRLHIPEEKGGTLLDRLNIPRSDIPAITHLDYSARIQSVSSDTNPKFHAVIKAFEDLTGCGVIVNTSFNIRGEPIVCTPQEAYACFMRTEMDVLVLENFLLLKEDQPDWTENNEFQESRILD
ncbi:carbamoyltransferase [Desulfobacterales bacterium HSG17]|nr:carbamoyltransferase [Desulfobacterales bacterium HSG17]